MRPQPVLGTKYSNYSYLNYLVVFLNSIEIQVSLLWITTQRLKILPCGNLDCGFGHGHPVGL